MLLVEDDDGDAVLVTALLDEVGAPVDVTRVRTAREAVAVLPGFDCVLLDLGLPDASGLDGLRRILERAGQAAVLVLTGHDDEERGIQALAVGAQDYLVKGQVDGSLLLRGIRYAIERRRAEDTHRQLREERLLAQETARLERGLLPSPLLTENSPRLTSRYRPGQRRMQLGGDFFDAVTGADGSLHVVIGDVCGHGPDEAALGVCLRIAWRTLVLAGLPDEQVLNTLQELLIHERHREGIFTTLCMATIQPDQAAAAVYLAGHPSPILIDDGGPRPLPRDRAGLPLGVLSDAKWSALELALSPGWSLLLYTDGLIEGRIGAGSDRLETEGLVELVARCDRPNLVRELVAAVERTTVGDLDDDLALVLLEDTR
ncbi:PP2C family protein-serine/threonine phosphatase [Kutzneria buriramensis]|uniref:Serine phosphatase RsbU (Regulator of sigma subunit) n=1 Tax=Kutzneria buriramensis TaxID=1045776 RepID=A0A3E0H3K3_9PSEU|nr:SpoIIE family protein phosphatase [Kutzneria buriramensis]REH37108.1 serine phosphatase RsbU (regulator of sigma subunit) [Kutzneria buriramensis]